MAIPEQIPDDVRSEDPSLWIVSRQEFDRAEPVRLILPVWLEIIFAVHSQERPPIQALSAKTRVQERYSQKRRLSASRCSLQGIAERPLPCKYNVIQLGSALSRR